MIRICQTRAAKRPRRTLATSRAGRKGAASLQAVRLFKPCAIIKDHCQVLRRDVSPLLTPPASGLQGRGIGLREDLRMSRLLRN